MNCFLCNQPERAFNFFTGKKEPVKPPPGAKRIVCSNCVQVLLTLSPEKRKQVRHMLKDNKVKDKSAAFKALLKGAA